MQVNVRYFAVLRERRGLDRETIETNAETLGALYDELSDRHALALDPALLRFAVDGELVSAASPLSQGSEVVFIPPVAGG